MSVRTTILDVLILPTLLHIVNQSHYVSLKWHKYEIINF